MNWIKSFLKILSSTWAEASKELECSVCGDWGQIEVLVMGTNTDWVECPYCKK